MIIEPTIHTSIAGTTWDISVKDLLHNREVIDDQFKASFIETQKTKLAEKGFTEKFIHDGGLVGHIEDVTQLAEKGFTEDQITALVNNGFFDLDKWAKSTAVNIVPNRNDGMWFDQSAEASRKTAINLLDEFIETRITQEVKDAPWFTEDKIRAMWDESLFREREKEVIEALEKLLGKAQ